MNFKIKITSSYNPTVSKEVILQTVTNVKPEVLKEALQKFTPYELSVSHIDNSEAPTYKFNNEFLTYITELKLYEKCYYTKYITTPIEGASFLRTPFDAEFKEYNTNYYTFFQNKRHHCTDVYKTVRELGLHPQVAKNGTVYCVGRFMWEHNSDEKYKRVTLKRIIKETLEAFDSLLDK